MSTKRVKIRPLSGGGVNMDNKMKLSKTLHEQKLKFTRIVEAGDSFAVVCLDEDNVEKLMDTTTIQTLRNQSYDVILPPQLRVRKCIIMRGLDSELNKWSEDRLKEDMESKDDWAQIEEVYRMKNILHMIKVRFTEISMAKKACELGVALHRTIVAPHQIELEEFIPITPCWVCYKYDHLTKDCQLKDVSLCSECANIGHTYKQCTSDIKKCLNCDGDHRTLASVCPIRKEILKNKREEKKKKKTEFENNNRTYCAVAKMSEELPRVIQQQRTPQTVLQVSD